MKKTFLITVCCAILLSISPIAYSADGLYVSGNLGLTDVPNMNFTDYVVIPPGPHIDLETKLGLAYGAAIGYGFLDSFRIEEEITRQRNDIKKEGSKDAKGKVTNTLILCNAYYDWPSKNAFKPFFSVGIGFASIETKVPNGRPLAIDYQRGVFAYEVGAGIGYAINDKVTFDCKYRYQGNSTLKYGTTKMDYSSHNLYIGIRYAF